MRWCGAVVIAAVAATVAVAGAGAPADEEDDTAAFALSVEGAGAGARCAGALVALRAALTSARCTRAPDLWVRAPHAAPAVRVLRVAVADLHAEEAVAVAGADGEWVWGGVGADLALLELAGSVRGARPILAAVGGECAPSAACYVPRGRARRMRVVAAALEPAARCVARGARWPSPLQERALCVLGSRLCRADWGAALVCGGKLCGVLSRSAQSDARDLPDEEARATRNDTRCGDTHAAVSVPRAHRFMRCAMLRGACGRGECEQVCAEHWLHDEPATERTRAPAPAPAPAPARASPAPAPAPATERTPAPAREPPPAPRTHGDVDYQQDAFVLAGDDGGGGGGADADARRSSAATARASGTDADSGALATTATVEAETRAETAASTDAGAGAGAEAGAGAVASVDEGAGTGAGADAGAAGGDDLAAATRILGQGSFDFEPNRADFKMTPARTTAVCLKAGEYGDNAAEYGAGEEGAACAPAAPTRSTPHPAVLHAEMEARVSPAAAPAPPRAPALEPRAVFVAAERAAQGRAPPRRARAAPLLLPLATACRLLCRGQ